MLVFISLNDAHVLKKMIQEIDMVNKSDNKIDGDDNNEILWQKLKKLKYCENVMNEVLRLRPPAGYVTFGVNPQLKKYKLGSGDCQYIVNNNWRITCSIAGICYSETIFDKPFDFNPDRWDGDGANKMKTVFVPFGGGVRTCPGRYFAKFEILMFFYCLLTNYNVCIQANTHHVMDKPQISPKNLVVRLKDRK